MKQIFLSMLLLPLVTILGMPKPSYAAEECFLGEIMAFGGNFAPRGWAKLDGQLLAISSNSALFSILGTTYGGDGRTTFALPDLRGRTPIGPRRGPGLTNRTLGQKLGQETVTLTQTTMASHNHPLIATTDAATTMMPANNLPASPPGLLGTRIYADGPPNATMNTDAIDAPTDGNQPHINMQPFLGLNYIIALQGIFPSRN